MSTIMHWWVTLITGATLALVVGGALWLAGKLWIMAIHNVYYAMKETLYIVAWLAWKGWHRANGRDALSLLESAIRADAADAAIKRRKQRPDAQESEKAEGGGE